jgi:anti-sigma B factor antagonist
VRFQPEFANEPSPSRASGQDLLSCRRYALNGSTIVAVAGEIDLHSAPTFRDELIAAIAEHSPRLVVDLTEVTFLDSSGVGVLVGALRRARAQRGWVRLVAPARGARRVLEITQLDRVFPIHDTVADATADGHRVRAADEPLGGENGR